MCRMCSKHLVKWTLGSRDRTYPRSVIGAVAPITWVPLVYRWGTCPSHVSQLEVPEVLQGFLPRSFLPYGFDPCSQPSKTILPSCISLRITTSGFFVLRWYPLPWNSHWGYTNVSSSLCRHAKLPVKLLADRRLIPLGITRLTINDWYTHQSPPSAIDGKMPHSRAPQRKVRDHL